MASHQYLSRQRVQDEDDGYSPDYDDVYETEDDYDDSEDGYQAEEEDDDYPIKKRDYKQEYNVIKDHRIRDSFTEEPDRVRDSFTDSLTDSFADLVRELQVRDHSHQDSQKDFKPVVVEWRTNLEVAGPPPHKTKVCVK